MNIKRISLISIFSYLWLFPGFSTGAETWNLSRDDYWTEVETAGTAKVDELRVNAVLRLKCNKNTGILRLEIADYEKVQKVFDLNNFEGPEFPANPGSQTTVELEGVNPAESLSFKQLGFISVENRFVFDINYTSLAKLYKRMATEGNLLRIRIKSYRDPTKSIISEFPLEDSRKAMASLATACVDYGPTAPKPAKGR
jgi:hypothetical protein